MFPVVTAAGIGGGVLVQYLTYSNAVNNSLLLEHVTAINNTGLCTFLLLRATTCVVARRQSLLTSVVPARHLFQRLNTAPA